MENCSNVKNGTTYITLHNKNINVPFSYCAALNGEEHISECDSVANDENTSMKKIAGIILMWMTIDISMEVRHVGLFYLCELYSSATRMVIFWGSDRLLPIDKTRRTYRKGMDVIIIHQYGGCSVHFCEYIIEKPTSQTRIFRSTYTSDNARHIK